MSNEIINHNINYLDQEEEVIKMFTRIVGEPTAEAKGEFYDYLQAEEDDVGPPVTDKNAMEEIERSMWRFVNAKLQTAWNAWKIRGTAVAGPTCDQCGDIRSAAGGRACELCDMAELDSAIIHTHSDDYDSEEERRQEMSENMERQMEEHERQCAANDGTLMSSNQCGYCLKTLNRCWCDEPLTRYETCKTVMDPKLEEALSRSVFEHNSMPTADPHIRISYNVSHPMPDNWQEIVNR